MPIVPTGRMCWSRRGQRLIVPGANSVFFVDGQSGAEVERWPHAYTAFACGAEEGWVAAAHARGSMEVRNAGRPWAWDPSARHAGHIRAVACSDDERRIFSAGEDGRVGLWRTAAREVAFFPVGGRAHDLAYDASSDTLAVAAGRAGVVLLDGSSGAQQRTVRPPDRATALAWLGDILFVGTRDGQLAAYDARRLEPVRPTAPLGLGTIARLLPLGDGLVVEGSDAVALLDAQTGVERWRFSPGATVAGGSIAVHAGTRALAIAVAGGSALVELDDSAQSDTDDAAVAAATAEAPCRHRGADPGAVPPERRRARRGGHAAPRRRRGRGRLRR